MPAVYYVNGSYVPASEASVHVEDRGYNFADGVYEFMNIVNGQPIFWDDHIDRLDYSLRELEIEAPISSWRVLRHLTDQLMRRNRISDGHIYLQITRGVAKRDHGFPSQPVPSSLVLIPKRRKPLAEKYLTQGVSVNLIPDIRWNRCDIKSISLLPNILGKQQAKEAGCYEAWMVKDGYVTEGTSTNSWIIDAQGMIRTHPATNGAILSGVTRKNLLSYLRELGIPYSEQPYTVDEIWTAREAFLSSTTHNIVPITMVDGKKIGDGLPGAMTMALRQLYIDRISDPKADFQAPVSQKLAA